MRKAINENPKVQMAVIGALLLVVGFFLVTRVMGGGGTEPAEVPPNAPIGSTEAGVISGAPATGAPATPTGAVPTDAAAAPVAPASSAPVTAGTVSPEALIPGPGLPAPVKAAWERGDAIVLLVVKPSATDDRLVLGSVRALSEQGTSVFVAEASKIARYSRITQGVGVIRVPALVVVRPKSVSGPVPEGQVSYGFRSTQSVVQAVNDALYEGRDDLPYSPG